MDIFLIVLALFLMILGILGSVLPVIPGPVTSWVGLFVLHFTEAVSFSYSFLTVTLIIALIVFILDYIIPSLGTKKFGGSKAGVIGTTLGLIVGLFFAPIGIILGPFLGALAGELYFGNSTDKALKAAFGSFLGFIASTFLKFMVSVVYLGFFISEIL